jgi:hypothetical protein
MLKILQMALIVSAAIFVAGIVLRLIMGKGTSLNKSVGAAFGILMIYVVSIVLSVTNHYEIFLNPLPFINLAGDHLTVFNLLGAGTDALAAELVKMMFLSFCVGVVQELVPGGKNIFVWFFLRCVVVVGSMAAHWALNTLVNTYVPGLLDYANVVLLAMAVLLLATTAFKWIVGGILGLTVSPIVGAIYGFIVGTLVGKKLFQAVLTTILITLLVYVLNLAGVFVVANISAAIVAFVPAVLVIIVVWYLVYKLL